MSRANGNLSLKANYVKHFVNRERRISITTYLLYYEFMKSLTHAPYKWTVIYATTYLRMLSAKIAVEKKRSEPKMNETTITITIS